VSSVELRGVAQRFARAGGADIDVLAGIDLDLEQGSFVCLVGPSGCGKSTLLRMIAGFQTPTEGTVSVGGRAVVGPGPDRGVVFQQPNLFPWLNVRDNVAYGPRMRGVAKRERRQRADEQLALVGLTEFGDHRPYELSGGMQQRCQLARVLINDPAIVLMDEPFGALDAITRERMQDELLRIWRLSRPTILFITHSVEEAVYLGTRALVMSARPGRIVADVALPFSSAPDHTTTARTTLPFVELRRDLAASLSGAWAA
jgi:ABC-type nitrate/sulfonate/bicarbonate transport system ATPase subunit